MAIIKNAEAPRNGFKEKAKTVLYATGAMGLAAGAVFALSAWLNEGKTPTNGSRSPITSENGINPRFFEKIRDLFGPSGTDWFTPPTGKK